MTTEAFTAVAERIAGKPLGAFFRSWLREMALPAIPR